MVDQLRLVRRRSSRVPADGSITPLKAIEVALRGLEHVLFYVKAVEKRRGNNDGRNNRRGGFFGGIHMSKGEFRRENGGRHGEDEHDDEKYLVVSEMRRGGGVRVHKVVKDGGKVVVVKNWGLGALRKVDGLGGAVGVSKEFVLEFGDRRYWWIAKSPVERARFLWRLLQLCKDRKGRLPPVLGLGLFELQRAAEGEEVVDRSSRVGRVAGGEGERGIGEAGSESDEVGGREPRSEQDSGNQAVGVVNGGGGQENANDNSNAADWPNNERSDDPVDSSEPPLARRLEIGDVSRALFDDPDMDIDGRAFIAAAHRMGRPNPRSPSGAAEAAETKMLVERCREEEKRRDLKLSPDLAIDFDAVYQEIDSHEDSSALIHLEEWLDSEIGTLERENLLETKRADEETKRLHPALRSVVHSLSEAEEWIRTCSDRLARSAEIVDEAKDELHSFDVQKSNVSSLRTTLDSLIMNTALREDVEKRINAILTSLEVDSSKAVVNDNYLKDEIAETAMQLGRKVRFEFQTPALLEIAAVSSGRQKLLTKRDQLLTLLLPVLEKRASNIAELELPRGDFAGSALSCSSLRNIWPFRSVNHLSAFASGATALACLQQDALKPLLSHCEFVSRESFRKLFVFLKKLAKISAKGDVSAYLAFVVESLSSLLCGEAVVLFLMFNAAVLSTSGNTWNVLSNILKSQFLEVGMLFESICSEVGGRRSNIATYWIAYLELADHAATFDARMSEREAEVIQCFCNAAIDVDYDESARSFASSDSFMSARSEQPHSKPLPKMPEKEDFTTPLDSKEKGVDVYGFLCDVLISYANENREKVELHINELINESSTAAFAASENVEDFVETVKSNVDLCIQLHELCRSRPVGRSSSSPVWKVTEQLCTKLITSSLKNIEIVAGGSCGEVAEAVRPAGYAYVCRYLSMKGKSPSIVKLISLYCQGAKKAQEEA